MPGGLFLSKKCLRGPPQGAGTLVESTKRHKQHKVVDPQQSISISPSCRPLFYPCFGLLPREQNDDRVTPIIVVTLLDHFAARKFVTTSCIERSNPVAGRFVRGLSIPVCPGHHSCRVVSLVTLRFARCHPSPVRRVALALAGSRDAV